MRGGVVRAVRACGGGVDTGRDGGPGWAGPGEVLVRLRASGVNPSDVKLRAGARGGRGDGLSADRAAFRTGRA